MKKVVLLLIFIVAFFLRVWRLGEVPPSLTWDEAALGYNAYSILKTGRDEYGNFLPLIFKSFGDYKPGLYVYLTVPFVWLFGLTELAVRLPSAILGTLSVLIVYLLTQELFSKKDRITYHVSHIASLLLAVSPWHINFSRGAWEANAALFFVLIGTYLFFRALRRKNMFSYLLSSIFYLLSLYAYQGAKLFVPLLILGLIAVCKKEILSINRKNLLLACLPFVLVIPLYLGALGKTGGRLKVMSVFSNPRPASDIQELLTQDKTSRESLVFKLFHSESLNFARGILGRYFNHFSGRFLFFEGDWQNPRLGAPYTGMLYFVELPLVLLGLSVLARSKSKLKYLLLWWFLVAPIPAAFSRDAVSSVRTLPMVIPLVILISLGSLGVLGSLGNRRKRILAVILLIAVYSWHLVYYLDQYYVHRAKKYSQIMQYGYKEAVDFLIQNFHEKYEKIIFTQSYGQPYIYWLFYTRYEPAKYQKQAHLIESPVGDVGRVEKIDNVEFRDIYWPADRGIGKSLFVGTEQELPLKDIDSQQAKVLEEIKFLNGQLAFRIVETR